MKNYRYGRLFGLVAAAVLAWCSGTSAHMVYAQTSGVTVAVPPVAPAQGPPRPEMPPPGPQFRDPTTPSPEMRRAIEAEQYTPKPGAEAKGPVMPEIKLMARLIGARGLPTAMLEVNGDLYRVQVNGSIQVKGQPNDAKLIVKELDEAGILVEYMPLKQTVLLY